MIVYTDGSCSKNPDGVGGWAYAVWDAKKKEPMKSRVGREYVTTSNRMELTAILECLRDIESPELILSDSQYAVNCISGVWRASANLDIILPAKSLLNGRDILKWIRGHAGDDGNEYVDGLCNAEMMEAFMERNGFSFSSVYQASFFH